MTNWIEDIKEFQTTFGLGVKATPGFPEIDVIKLRHKLITEEVRELTEAEFGPDGVYHGYDIIEAADAITDCLYVLLGTACEYGLIDQIDECWKAVHTNNMSKVGPDGKVLRREDGKIIKPAGFQPVNLEPIIYG
jgi:predicted HAD superfamily Cof-like phosphohydrolase